MRASIEIRAFRAAYRDAAQAVVSIVASERSGALDEPWFPIPATSDRLNLRGYLAACEALYVEALELVQRRFGAGLEPPRVFDAGGSFGAFALALAALGIRVTTREPLGGLGGAATALVHALEEASVDVHSDATASQPPHETGDGGFDLMICLALQSHTGSLDKMAAAASRLVRPSGELVIAVANARYWPSRVHELRRRAARPFSDRIVPHAEASYTETRLHTLLRAHDLSLRSVRACNCSPRGIGGPTQQLATEFVMRALPLRREVLLACATPSGRE